MSIAITGNPGVGKHTIAKNLRKVLNFKIIDINKIAIDEGIYVKSDEVLDVDISELKKILKSKITKKTLVVGHLVPYTLTKSAVNFVIVLRRNPYKLLKVYKERNNKRNNPTIFRKKKKKSYSGYYQYN